MGYVTVSVDVDVDYVIDEIDTDFLVKELRARAKRGDAKATSALGGEVSILSLNDWDSESLRCAVMTDDGRRVVDLLRPVIGSL